MKTAEMLSSLPPREETRCKQCESRDIWITKGLAFTRSRIE